MESIMPCTLTRFPGPLEEKPSTILNSEDKVFFSITVAIPLYISNPPWVFVATFLFHLTIEQGSSQSPSRIKSRCLRLWLNDRKGFQIMCCHREGVWWWFWRLGEDTTFSVTLKSSSKQVSIDLNFLLIPLIVDMGIWLFLYNYSLTYEGQHSSTSFDLNVLLSFPCWRMTKGIWTLCVFIPQWNRKLWITAWTFLNTRINNKNKSFCYIMFIRM